MLTSSHSLLLSGNFQRHRLESDLQMKEKSNTELITDVKTAVEKITPKFN